MDNLASVHYQLILYKLSGTHFKLHGADGSVLQQQEVK